MPNKEKSPLSSYSIVEEAPAQEQTPNKQDIVKEGWIEVKSSNVWQKKYAILYRNGPVFLHNDKNVKRRIFLKANWMQFDSASGIIYMNNAKVFAHAEKNGVAKPRCFNVRSTNKNFLLRASSKEEKDDWCTALKENIRISVIPVMLQDIPESGSFIIPKERMAEIRDIINKEQEPFRESNDPGNWTLSETISLNLASKRALITNSSDAIALEEESTRPASPLGESSERV